MADYPLINGFRHDWSSAEIKLAGTVVRGIKSLSYKPSSEPGEVFGTHAQKLGRTRGQLKFEASIELYLTEYEELKGSLGDGYLEKSFSIVAQYSEEGQPVVTDELLGCRIKSPDKSFQSGSDALTVKLDLDVMLIIENGVKPLTNTLGV